jgi:hypothetical protein
MNLGRHPGRRRLATRLAACLVPLGLALALAAPASASVPPPEPTVPAGTPADEAPDESPAAAAPVEFVQSWTLTPGGGPDGGEAGSRPNLSYQLAPGTSVDDTVVVYNLGNTPLDLRVYATDAFNNADGDFDLLPGDELPSDVGSWVLLATDQVSLAPGTQATIPIRITVPPDASPGDHVGAILASSVSTFDDGDGPTIDVDRRTGTRLYVRVEGDFQSRLSITDVATDYDQAANPLGGSAQVSFRLENTGDVRLSGRAVVSVAGPFGLSRSTMDTCTFGDDPGTEADESIAERLPCFAFDDLLPGEEITFTTDIERVVERLDGVPALFALATEIEVLPNGGGEPLASTTSWSFAPPVTVLLVLLVAVLVWLLVRALRRHRRGEIEAAGAAEDERMLETASP